VLPPSAAANHLVSPPSLQRLACVRGRLLKKSSKHVPIPGSAVGIIVTSVARPRSAMRFRGRSYMAFALAPSGLT
jgi:hypothetical protein